MTKIKIAIAIILIFWCGSSIKIVKGGGKGQIVSSETVKIDSGTTEIKMVSPDEIQRIEDDRDREYKILESRIFLLEVKLSKLESEVYQ